MFVTSLMLISDTRPYVSVLVAELFLFYITSALCFLKRNCVLGTNKVTVTVLFMYPCSLHVCIHSTGAQKVISVIFYWHLYLESAMRLVWLAIPDRQLGIIFISPV